MTADPRCISAAPHQVRAALLSVCTRYTPEASASTLIPARTLLQPWKQQLAQLVPELSLETKKFEGPAAKAAIIGGEPTNPLLSSMLPCLLCCR